MKFECCKPGETGSDPSFKEDDFFFNEKAILDKSS